MKIDYIIIHDTEANPTTPLVQDPTYVSWQYDAVVGRQDLAARQAERRRLAHAATGT